MLATIVHQRVKDYSMWRKEFDTMQSMRSAQGASNDHVFHDEMDPNMLKIILKWSSIDNAKKFYNSPELMDAQRRGGLDGPSSISYLIES